MASSSIALSGLASGFDWQSVVTQLVALERSPEAQMQAQQNALGEQGIALGGIKTELGSLQSAIALLKDSTFFDSRTATASDSTLASATADSATAVGKYSFSVSQLASTAAWKGTTGVSGSLSSTDDVSALTLSAAPFAQTVTAGTFTVNGKQITIATGDTLQSVFDQISEQTDGAVTGSYSAADDKISLSSSDAIILGSGADTSNFLQVAKLSNTNAVTNEDGSITLASAAKLGAVQAKRILSAGNFATPATDGGSGSGAFKINGVTISFSASSDSLNDVVDRINSSDAGVTASYDVINNRLSLTNKSTGDMGISMEDVTGNFLTATGLTSGTLTRGTNLLYKVNDGPELFSQTNSITGDSSGITGLNVTALDQGDFTVTVAGDTAKIKSAITSFVSHYNRVQSMINTETASTTDATGKVTSGTLAGDQDTLNLNSRLRELMNSSVDGLSGTVKRLESLGFVSNGYDDSLSTSDLSGLDKALATNLSGLKDFFSNSSTGLAGKMDTFLTATIGDSGSLVTHQATLTKQSTDIDTQISDMEAQILIYQQQLNAGFVAMEVAQSKINQQLTYLAKTFGGTSSGG